MALGFGFGGVGAATTEELAVVVSVSSLGFLAADTAPDDDMSNSLAFILVLLLFW